MYAQSVIDRRIQQALTAGEVYYTLPVGDGRSVKRCFEPTEHSIAEVDASISALDALVDQDSGKLKRPLDEAEIAFITNERFLCRLNYHYYSSRYALIKDEEGRNVRYSPRVPQRIFQDIVAEHDANEWPVELQVLKARQLGMSREISLMFGHRVMFWSGVQAVLASADEGKSQLLAAMMEYPIDRLPWWLAPSPTLRRTGEYIIYGDQDSAISIESGNQFNGIARGTTPTCVQLSELCEFMDPEELVEASLFPAIHPSRWTFLVLESTALGRGNWWHESWKKAKKDWVHGRSRLRPLFLPWFTGSDVYPKEDFVRMHSAHIANYTPKLDVLHHARAAEAYVRSNELLKKYLGSDWHMTKEQMFWYEVKRDEYREKGILNKFLAEYCVAAGERVSTEKGIIPIEAAVSELVYSCERGTITAHHDNGERQIVEVLTKNGRSLKVTPDHQLFSVRGGDAYWRPASDLIPGDVLHLSPPTFSAEYETVAWQWTPSCEMSIQIDEDWGRLLGYFLGDGCWGSNAVIVTCNAKDEDAIADVSGLMERCGGKYPTHQRQRGATQVVSSSVRWFEMIFNLGVIEHQYSKSQKRNSGYRKRLRVPECIWRSPKNVVAQFLRGLFESDGFAHQQSCQIGWFTKDPVFAREVQLLLLGFGINAIYRREEKVRDGRRYYGTKLRLNARAAEIFYTEIGFVSARKQSGKRPSVRLGRKPDDIEMEDVVLSVTPAGTSPVFDLTVAGQHCYGANGILVHNCSSDDEAFQSTNISVFDVEVITDRRQRARSNEPLGVFGLVTKEDIFPKRFQPRPDQIDTRLPKIDIRWPWGNGFPMDFTLEPLKWNGYGDDDEEGLGKIFLYEMPNGRSDYGFGVDTGDGVGKDRSVVEMIRKGNVFERPAQVCQYASPYINSHYLWPIAAAMASLFATSRTGVLSQPKSAIECRGNGDTVQHELSKRGYYNHHKWVRIDSAIIRPGKAHKIGVFTNNWFRKQCMDWLLSFLQDDRIDIRSPYTVYEMECLEADEYTQAMKAEHGGHDDRLMALSFIIVSLYQHEIMRGQGPEDQNPRDEEDPVFSDPSQGLIAGRDAFLAKMQHRRTM